MTKNQWHTIDTYEDLETIIRDSHHSPQLIFKHSYSCGISGLIKNRLEKEDLESDRLIPIHLIDVVKNREISHRIANQFDVRHESPQILLISNDQCTFHTSHFDVSLKTLPAYTEE